MLAALDFLLLVHHGVAACGVPQNNLRVQNKVGRSPHDCGWVAHKSLFPIERNRCFTKSIRN